MTHDDINQLGSALGPGQLSSRLYAAIEYRQAYEAGQIAQEEYHGLMGDLLQLQNIDLSAKELELKINFDRAITILASLPLP